MRGQNKDAHMQEVVVVKKVEEAQAERAIDEEGYQEGKGFDDGEPVQARRTLRSHRAS